MKSLAKELAPKTEGGQGLKPSQTTYRYTLLDKIQAAAEANGGTVTRTEPTLYETTLLQHARLARAKTPFSEVVAVAETLELDRKTTLDLAHVCSLLDEEEALELKKMADNPKPKSKR